MSDVSTMGKFVRRKCALSCGFCRPHTATTSATTSAEARVTDNDGGPADDSGTFVGTPCHAETFELQMVLQTKLL